jgi:hypothetical protein
MITKVAKPDAEFRDRIAMPTDISHRETTDPTGRAHRGVLDVTAGLMPGKRLREQEGIDALDGDSLFATAESTKDLHALKGPRGHAIFYFLENRAIRASQCASHDEARQRVDEDPVDATLFDPGEFRGRGPIV